MSDTGCYPECLTVMRRRGRVVHVEADFTVSNFSRFAAGWLAFKLNEAAALPAPTTDATGARDRQAACEAGLRAALAAVSDRQERDAAAARLQDQYGAPAYQAARILAALTSTPGATTP